MHLIWFHAHLFRNMLSTRKHFIIFVGWHNSAFYLTTSNLKWYCSAFQTLKELQEVLWAPLWVINPHCQKSCCFIYFFLNCDLTVEPHVRTSPFSSAQSYVQKESDYFISFGDLNFLFSPPAGLVELSPLLTLVKGHSPSSPYFLLTHHNNLGLTAPASC